MLKHVSQILNSTGNPRLPCGSTSGIPLWCPCAIFRDNALYEPTRVISWICSLVRYPVGLRVLNRDVFRISNQILGTMTLIVVLDRVFNCVVIFEACIRMLERGYGVKILRLWIRNWDSTSKCSISKIHDMSLGVVHDVIQPYQQVIFFVKEAVWSAEILWGVFGT